MLTVLQIRLKEIDQGIPKISRYLQKCMRNFICSYPLKENNQVL